MVSEVIRFRVDEELKNLVETWYSECRRRGVRASRASVCRAAMRLAFALAGRNQEIANYFFRLVAEDSSKFLSRLPPTLQQLF